jgi:nucleotide-binding universal stress UspA family protein
MTIIVGIDGSPVSRQALAWAVAEGKLRGTPVRAVYVWELAPAVAPSGHVFGGPVDDMLIADLDGQRRAAEQRLAETVAAIDDTDAVELQVLEGDPATVLCEQSAEGELLVVGSHGHGGLASVLLGSVSQACTHHAACPVVVVREPDAIDAAWDPAEVIAREHARNAETWDALVRLGVDDGSALALEFVYETSGEDADRALADYLQREHGYAVEVESGGVTGQTPPIPVSPTGLDAWVETMVLAGHEHGGCVFGGWTATLQAGRTT